MCQGCEMLIYSYSIPKENKKFLNDKVAKKILKDDVYGKKICSRVLADLLELDYDEVKKIVMGK